jgi:uncharacterized protein YndB with AHSA1/START domain
MLQSGMAEGVNESFERLDELLEKMKNKAASTKKKDIVVTRIFAAPVREVWKAWIDPELVKRWWGPKLFIAPLAKMDFREGGKSLVCMRSPEGQDFYSTWEYHKIVPLKLIDFVQNMSGKVGKRVNPSVYGLPGDFPEDVRSTVTFAEIDGKTEMVVMEYGYTSDQQYELSKAGLEECLDKMAEIFKKTELIAR